MAKAEQVVLILDSRGRKSRQSPKCESAVTTAIYFLEDTKSATLFELAFGLMVGLAFVGT